MSKILTGKIVSTKMNKTVVVEVEKAFRHRLYQKTIRKHKRFKAHAEAEMNLKMGDRVDIEETRPISKDKHFKVVQKNTKK
ncbi:30S ribosomal protein S17 [Candidatus Roizmanbacteria bacterium RIFCSPHIGHO2_12_FULL_44_10]|uniref:Small ribosomal subunit protein uS17 n=1 Tax=Candidatus Roizmanbacteria bacterium RIFCSPHIGHO2_12_FULL_44_10 TaxID=1802054 RepID=A0A1F7I8E7_9BACT|nr:MAG: 30S ribosomal protein S17 [Candidatus Roizmanbacteria bacterium RIFCSPHIGHO2_12_FULL_44_10]